MTEGEGAIGVTAALGVKSGAAIDGDGIAATAVAEGDGPAAVSPIPPRANANATDALTAITSRTIDANMGVVRVRPVRTIGAGVSTTTAAPRK
jgi:hypothetical protein